MWDDYRMDVWSDESLNGIIDSLSAVLAEPSVRDHARWPRLGQYVWPNVFIGQTYEEEVAFAQLILDRVAWLDDNIEGTIPGCTDVMACNYEPTALFDDGSCEPCECPGDGRRPRPLACQTFWLPCPSLAAWWTALQT